MSLNNVPIMMIENVNLSSRIVNIWVFVCKLGKLAFYLISKYFQADTETDEVYAQMTLQPVPSVRI